MVTFGSLVTRLIIIIFWVLTIFSFLYLWEIISFKTDPKSINVFAWSGMFDLQYVAQFEKQTGIQVNFSYYESNAELLAKLRVTKGKGYDLIVPSDYAVAILRQENLLKELDRTKMPFFNNLNSILLGHYYDPANNYSVPFEWSVFGLGIDKDFFAHKISNPSWDLVFNKEKVQRKIVMPNDPLVAVPLAALYLFGSLDNITLTKLEKIKKLLIDQWPHVEAYTDFRADYYIATKNTPVAVASSSYMWRSMRHYKHSGFIIPTEGSLVTIESFAIPKSSRKEDLVYQFMTFMLTAESVMHSFKKFAFFPPTRDVLDKLEVNQETRALLTMSADEFARFHFFRLDYFCKPITEQHLQDLWVMVKR